MTTQEIANKLVELCRKGEYDTCYRELYSPNAVSIEPEGTPEPRRAEGMEAMRQKGEMLKTMVEQVHDSSVGDPIVADKYFACQMMIDWTLKGVGRQRLQEICVYKVEDGKVVSEEFFY